MTFTAAFWSLSSEFWSFSVKLLCRGCVGAGGVLGPRRDAHDVLVVVAARQVEVLGVAGCRSPGAWSPHPPAQRRCPCPRSWGSQGTAPSSGLGGGLGTALWWRPPSPPSGCRAPGSMFPSSPHTSALDGAGQWWGGQCGPWMWLLVMPPCPRHH